MTEQKYDEEELELWKRVIVPKKEKITPSFPILPPEMKLLDLIRVLMEVSGEYKVYKRRISEETEENIEKRVKNLEKEIQNIKRNLAIIQEQPLESDRIYEKFKEELEKEHYGKIVAIDLESGNVAGIGNTILEAYKEARKKSKKTRFAYRKVGYPFIYKL